MKTLLVLTLGIFLFFSGSNSDIDNPVFSNHSGDGSVRQTKSQSKSLSKIESFSFSSKGKAYMGKIYLPPSFENNKNLPAIFLIDFTEQHFKLATDEFEKVIDGVNQIPDFEALVVSTEEILDIDAEPEAFEEHFAIYKDMASYVSGKYTENSSRTFIGKGSESGVVMMALLHEKRENSVFDNFIATDPSGNYASALIKLIESGNAQQSLSGKKLHFSFSTSNDRSKCTKLINLFEQYQDTGLQFESVEYTESTYENTYPVSFAEGLKFVYQK